MPLTDDDFAGPYDLNHGPGVKLGEQPPAAQPPAAPVPESTAGKTLRDMLPIPPEARNILTEKSPEWGDIPGALNDRVEYLYNRLGRGWDERMGRPLGPMPESPDIVTRGLGGIFQGVGRDSVLYAIPGMRYPAMVGNLIDEYAGGFPAWERNLLGGASQFLNPRSLISAMGHGAMASLGHRLAGVPGQIAGALLHSPSALYHELANPRNWAKAIAAGHEAGADERPGGAEASVVAPPYPF